MDATTAIILASNREVSTVTSIISKARKKNISRSSSKSTQSTFTARSRSHSCTRYLSTKGFRDEYQAAVAEKKAKKDLKKAVEISGRYGDGDYIQSVYLVKWTNMGNKRNITQY